jgi:hypothetical protein
LVSKPDNVVGVPLNAITGEENPPSDKVLFIILLKVVKMLMIYMLSKEKTTE